MGRVYKRKEGGGGAWWGYWIDAHGKKHRRTLNTHDKAVATARLRDLERGGGMAAPDPPAAETHTLNQALADAFAMVRVKNAADTLDCYVKKARHLVRLLGAETPLALIGRTELLGYVALRKSEGASASTVHKELVVMRLTFGEAQKLRKWSGAIGDAVPQVRVAYRPRVRRLTELQAESFLLALPAKRRLWALLALFGGLCLGEVERAAWEDISFVTDMMRVQGTKRTSRYRLVPIAPRLKAALVAAAPPGHKGPVVEHWKNVRRDMAIACDKAGVPTVSPNDLRRTYASWLKNKRIDSAVVARLLGHASTRMVDLVYGQLDDATLAQAISVLPGGGGIGPAPLATELQLPASAACTPRVHDGTARGTSGETIATKRGVHVRRKSA